MSDPEKVTLADKEVLDVERAFDPDQVSRTKDPGSRIKDQDCESSPKRMSDPAEASLGNEEGLQTWEGHSTLDKIAEAGEGEAGEGEAGER